MSFLVHDTPGFQQNRNILQGLCTDSLADVLSHDM